MPKVKKTKNMYKSVKTADKITCQLCGKEFPAGYRKGNRFCSRECYVKFLEKIRRKTKCMFCGKEFSPASNSTKFCSLLCWREYQFKMSQDFLKDKVDAYFPKEDEKIE